MKAISVKDPWAGMILHGEKLIETRTWKTNYRGDLLICVSKKPASALSGFAVCVVNLIDCRPMTDNDEVAAKCECYYGAYSWVLDNVRKIEMFPVKGQLGLFNIENNKINYIS